MNVSQGPQAGYISRISSETEVIEPRYSLSKSGVYGETPIKRITAFLAAVLGDGDGNLCACQRSDIYPDTEFSVLGVVSLLSIGKS